MGNLNVHGHIVSFDENSKNGVYYLINLDYGKAEEIFNKSVSNGSATFECEYGGYKLTWNGGPNYKVSKKY